MEFGYLGKQVYCNSRQALAELMRDVASEEGNNAPLNLSQSSSLWKVYDDSLTDHISWPCSEERLALVLYLYLSGGILLAPLASALSTYRREIILAALLNSETQLVNKKQCMYLAEVFGKAATKRG